MTCHGHVSRDTQTERQCFMLHGGVVQLEVQLYLSTNQRGAAVPLSQSDPWTESMCMYKAELLVMPCSVYLYYDNDTGDKDNVHTSN